MRYVAFAFVGAVLVTGQQCAPSDPGAGPSTLRPPSAVDVLGHGPRGPEHDGHSDDATLLNPNQNGSGNSGQNDGFAPGLEPVADVFVE